MPVFITTDTSALDRKLLIMIRKIDHFKRIDVGTGMSDWQTQDMHRHRPFTMRARRAGRAATIVRPHSRFETKRSARYQSGLLRRAASKAKRKSKRFLQSLQLWQRKTSTRPILREELGRKLWARMIQLLEEKLRWS